MAPAQKETSKNTARTSATSATEEPREMNHRIIGWKRPLRSSSPTVNPTPPCLLNHAPRCHIYTLSWTPPGMVTQPLPWAACSNVWPLFQIFPNIQSKPLTQLEAIASCPIASYFGETSEKRQTSASLQPPFR